MGGVPLTFPPFWHPPSAMILPPGPRALPSSPVRAIKGQFFFAFAVMGSLLPYLPVYLADRGLSDPQIGWVLGVGGLAILLTPALMTLLADAHLENRTLLAGAFALAGLALLWLLAARGFWFILAAYGLVALAIAPLSPLQDGVYFRRQQRGPTPNYHRVRVYGTVGFIVPSLLLYVWLSYDVGTGVTLLAAIITCILGTLNALRLPRLRIPPAAAPGPRTRLPTLAAARLMLRPRVLTFCLAMWLIHLAIAGYYSFYPLYLTRQIGLDTRWIGLIANLGVTVEVAFMLGFGLLVRRIGLRGLMAAGAAAMALRFALLALAPNVYVAVGTQALHGLMVLVVWVGPPIYLNARAGDAYRSSIQGLFAMLVMGSGRMIGNALAGYVAHESLLAVFACSAGLCLLAVPLLFLALREPTEPR